MSVCTQYLYVPALLSEYGLTSTAHILADYLLGQQQTDHYEYNIILCVCKYCMTRVPHIIILYYIICYGYYRDKRRGVLLM